MIAYNYIIICDTLTLKGYEASLPCVKKRPPLSNTYIRSFFSLSTFFTFSAPENSTDYGGVFALR